MRKSTRFLGFLAFIVAQSAIAQTLNLSPGKSARFTLKENPSTGYGWRIDPASSSGLDRVTISDAGFRAGARMPGAPGRHCWRILGVAHGDARISFVYQREWERVPAETRRLDIVVAPR